MSIIGFILLLIIIYFVILPIARVWLTIHKARRQAKEFFGGGQQNTRQRDAQQRGYSQYGSYQRPRHAKKIDPDVGEYVDFEEINTYSSRSSAEGTSQVRYQREEQIQDVEWEDIPNK